MSVFKFTNIAIFPPRGISNAVFATPVAAAIKQASPAAQVTMVVVEKLRDLLITVCPSVDEVLVAEEFEDRGGALQIVNQLKPDLIINLSGEPITKTLSYQMSHFFKGGKTPEIFPVAADGKSHVVDRFLQIIEKEGVEPVSQAFPTMFPEALKDTLVAPLFEQYGLSFSEPIVGLIPGVGAGYTTKGWMGDGWSYLIGSIATHFKARCVLIGGEADVELCNQIEAQSNEDNGGGSCVNLCGKISLTEAAAVLKALALVVGGDCGLLHVAVAASTPVIGLYGPTSPVMTGPYKHDELVVDQNSYCTCEDFKVCQGMLPGPGDCMRQVTLQQILAKLTLVLGENQELPTPARDSTNWFWAKRRV